MAYKIELKDVAFGFKESSKIINHLNFVAHPGEVTAIITPVGGGKSTLLKICAGLIEPHDGEIIINGQNFWNLSTYEQNEIRRHMGFDFQEGALIANMNIFDNLAFPLRYHGELKEGEIKKKIEGWLDCLDLIPYQSVLPAALSMGLRRRVSFIRAMLLGRDFFFWDEPTQDADEKFIKIITDTIQNKKKEGIGIIVTTQNSTFLKAACDKAMIIRDGKVIYSGPLEDGRIPVDISTGQMLRK